jgi:hypothetical protein
MLYRMTDTLVIQTVLCIRHLRSRANESENVLNASSPLQSSASGMGATSSGRAQENVIYQSADVDNN